MLDNTTENCDKLAQHIIDQMEVGECLRLLTVMKSEEMQDNYDLFKINCDLHDIIDGEDL